MKSYGTVHGANKSCLGVAKLGKVGTGMANAGTKLVGMGRKEGKVESGGIKILSGGKIMQTAKQAIGGKKK